MIGGETVMAVIQGTERGEFLGGTLSGDRIFGLGGDDLIQADPTFFDFVGGNDFVDGGSGNDQIFTFGGNDQVNSGSGNDAVQTADGVDRIDAGSATTMSKAAGARTSCLAKPGTTRFEAVKITTTSAAATAATE
jgi:Ca2+-binding RTX toxin-like protein